MSYRQPNWYALNATRPYPLDDSATGTTDDGDAIKGGILVDCHLRFPRTLGRYVFLGGLTVTDRLVTAVFLAAESQTTTSGFVPLAAVNLVKPLVEGRHYPVQALVAGVGGFVVFGDVTESRSFRFATPQQSLLLPRCARAYDPLPIPTLRKLGRDVGLSNLVTLKQGTDIEIVKEEVDIEGVGLRDAIVIRLKDNITGTNVLSRYLGPCDSRPESRNCARPGIETINDAAPDCDGNLNIVFEELIDGPFESCGGTTLDASVGLDEACVREIPGRFAGTDFCNPSSSSSAGSEFMLMAFDEAGQHSSSIASPFPELQTPFCINFDNASPVHFATDSGNFAFETEDEPGSASLSADATWTLAATDVSRRNIVLCDGYQPTHLLNKRITTDLQLHSDSLYRNGGIVFNHRARYVGGREYREYMQVLLDHSKGRLQLLHYTGQAPIVEVASVQLRQRTKLGHWYRLQVLLRQHPHDASQWVIQAAASGVTEEDWPAISLSTTTGRPADGLIGLGSINSHARFSYLAVEDIHG